MAIALIAAAARCSSFDEQAPGTSPDAATVDGVAPGADGSSTDGACTPSPSFESDPRHCGRCGRDCGGGTCEDGACRPYVVVDQVKAPFYVEVDDAFAYWTSHKSVGGVGTVQRVDKIAGGVPQTIAALENSFDMAFAGEWLFVTAPAQSAVGLHRMLRDGGSATAEYEGGVLEVTASGGAVYFTASNDSVLARSPEGALRTVVADGGEPEGVVVHGGLVYWANNLPLGSIGRVAEDGAQPIPGYVGGEQRPRRGTTDGTALYWTSNALGGAVSRKVLGDGNVTVRLLEDAGVNRGSVVVDADHLYATLETAGRVVRMNKVDGSDLRVLAEGLDLPTGLAQDETAIYFTERGKDRIWRMVK